MERDLKLIRFSANISPYLARFVHKIVIFFSSSFIRGTFIQPKDRVTEVNFIFNDYSMNL